MSQRWKTDGISEVVVPDALGLDDDAIAKLFEAAEATTSRHPRCAAQVAVARHGRLAAFRSFGRATIGGAETHATERTLFCMYSCTKAIVASAVWILLQEGRLRLGDRVAEHIPDFGNNGKGTVTVEHLLTHTSGFPDAAFPVSDWLDPRQRLERFASWELAWPPGSRFVYHGTSSMWVLAELITRAAGVDYREFVRCRIVEASNLPDLFNGLPDAEHARVADVVSVGKAMSAERRAVSPVDAPVINQALVAAGNDATCRRIGSPGGGAIATAAGLALFLPSNPRRRRRKRPGDLEA